MDGDQYRILLKSKYYTEEQSIVKKVLVKFEAEGQKGEVNKALQTTGGIQSCEQPVHL
jgi:hypothetical protein